ncbi:hypothetical protein GS601_19775 [Myxacorys almedinensis A]|uniref:Uncharacterized protein n=1 Tax=Myxacorys almedinensis A TaxID=2690445 RepID=A0A8J7Z7S5_9CYAN|nr:hypothetical protein [Myxacorys almedinensis A]
MASGVLRTRSLAYWKGDRICIKTAIAELDDPSQLESKWNFFLQSS